MGNIATIASCKCNKQQDHSEMDLNKDKQELLKDRENSKRENENPVEDGFLSHNINIDKINFGDIGILNKNENLHQFTPDGFTKIKEVEKTNQDTLQNNYAKGSPFEAFNNGADIKQYSENLNNKNANSHADLAMNNSELENFSNNINLQPPKSLTHLKSNSNEIKMDIYEDESAQHLNNNPLLKNLKNQISNRKKFNNSNTNSSLGNKDNSDGVKKSPLEIINENNADASKESFYEGNSITNKLIQKQENEEKQNSSETVDLNKNPDFSNINEQINQNLNKINAMNNVEIDKDNKINGNVSNLIDSKENAFDNTVEINENKFDNSHNPNNSNFNYKANVNNDFNNNYNNNKSINSGFNMMSNYNSENVAESQNNQINNLSEMQKNYGSYQGFRSNQPVQTRFKKPQGAKEERWKSIKITSIVSERILLSNQEDLKKLNNTSNMVVKDNLIYTTRFCILNKVCFKIFKNRETFLRLQKPQIEIPINSIKDCNYVHLNSQKANKNFHFYINYLSILGESRMEENDASVIVEKYNQKIKKLGFVGGESNNISKDNSTIKKSFDNSHAFESHSNPLLIFASEDEELTNKWIAVLNYFLSK